MTVKRTFETFDELALWTGLDWKQTFAAAPYHDRFTGLPLFSWTPRVRRYWRQEVFYDEAEAIQAFQFPVQTRGDYAGERGRNDGQGGVYELGSALVSSVAGVMS
jgi:hypothetical protein